jgi:predicted glycoside hydrolase/deacetylase ChbG (UPF0249 family)
MQKASIPLLATLFLGLATARAAWLHSRPAWKTRKRGVGAWERLPEKNGKLAFSIILPIPFARDSETPLYAVRELMERTVAFATEYSKGAPFEILVVPYGDRVSRSTSIPLLPGANLRLIDAPTRFERGAAIRDAFLESQGAFLWCLNFEQSCDLEFFERAQVLLMERQAQIVHANRRHPDTRFRIPVKHLRLVFGRHQLGLLFNHLVRLLLPIRTRDTHSGIWAMSRTAALRVFGWQWAPGFLFDLEIELIARAHALTETDLPINLYLAQEKTARRMSSEMLAIARGLPTLAWRYRRGYYHPQQANQGITADDWGLTPGVNQGILELAQANVVRRVSLMANGKFLQENLSELLKLSEVRLGLHFDLTYGKDTPAQVLWRWMRPGADRANLGEAARVELRRQLEILNSAGVRPQYLDGHHHIHLVPGLLDALAPTLRAAGLLEIRLPMDHRIFFSKFSLVALAWFARPSFRRLGLKPLPCIYPQPKDFEDLGKLRALVGAYPLAEVIVHPASRDDLSELNIPDPYTSGRVHEFQALRMLSL